MTTSYSSYKLMKPWCCAFCCWILFLQKDTIHFYIRKSCGALGDKTSRWTFSRWKAFRCESCRSKNGLLQLAKATSTNWNKQDLAQSQRVWNNFHTKTQHCLHFVFGSINKVLRNKKKSRHSVVCLPLLTLLRHAASRTPYPSLFFALVFYLVGTMVLCQIWSHPLYSFTLFFIVFALHLKRLRCAKKTYLRAVLHKVVRCRQPFMEQVPRPSICPASRCFFVRRRTWYLTRMGNFIRLVDFGTKPWVVAW